MRQPLHSSAPALRRDAQPVRARGLQTLGFGMLPAFREPVSGETHLATNRDGTPAPAHLLEGLPEAWVEERDDHGQVVSLKPGIIAGFLRNGRFYSCLELLRAPPLDA